MAHPSNRGRRRKSPQEKVEKANQDTNISSERNLNPATTRMRLGAYSIPSLSTVQGQIYEQARRELRFPQSTKIFKQMSLDANIAAAIALIEAMIGKIDWEMKVKPDASQEEKDRAEKLNYNMLTMDRPWQEYIIEALSILVYGFHVPEKIYKKIDDSPVGSFVGLKDLRTISQDTVDKWIFSNTTGDLVGLRQDLSRLTGGTQLVSRTERSQQDIPRKKFILFRHNPKRNNPEGHSPLLGPYLSWKYKSINISRFVR